MAFSGVLTGLACLSLGRGSSRSRPARRDPGQLVLRRRRRGGGNNGGSPKLKLKSYQEMSLIDVDPNPLRGTGRPRGHAPPAAGGRPTFKAGHGRQLRLALGRGDGALLRGPGREFDVPIAAHPDVPWTPDGGDLCRVILGQGGPSGRWPTPRPPDADGWVTVPVDPSVVAARVAGVSEGFLLFDDTGLGMDPRGGEIHDPPHAQPLRIQPRRRPQAGPLLDRRRSAPKTARRRRAPARSARSAKGLPAGEALVSWVTPRDAGPAGTARVLRDLDGRDVPR